MDEEHTPLWARSIPQKLRRGDLLELGVAGLVTMVRKGLTEKRDFE